MITLDELCRLHYISVYKRARFLTHDDDTALEVTQEVFCRATRSYSTLHKESNIGAWLWCVTGNIVKDMYKHKRIEAVSMEALTHPCEGRINESWHPVTHHDTAYNRVIAKEGLRELCDILNEKQRMCYLAQLIGYSYQEIAEYSGLTVKSVTSQIKMAQRRMKEIAERELRAS